MTFKEFKTMYDEMLKTMTKKQISFDLKESESLIEYYLKQAILTPERGLPKGKVYK